MAARTAPHWPATSSPRKRTMSGAQRRLWLTAIFTPALAHTSTAAAVSAALPVTGFSQKTSRGCSESTAAMCAACSAVGEHRLTTS